MKLGSWREFLEFSSSRFFENVFSKQNKIELEILAVAAAAAIALQYYLLKECVCSCVTIGSLSGVSFIEF
jgi:hypothetical protein